MLGRRHIRIPLSTPERQHFVQIAYHVADLDVAMQAWQRRFGMGPFILRRHIALDQVSYRGRPATLDISAAHVQAGPIQIELVMQHCDQPSAFRDAFAPHEEGMHHVALFPEDHGSMVAHYAEQGFSVATDLVTAEQRGASYVDTRPALGHMIEIYRVNESLHALYALVAEAAENWDGRTLFIEQ